MNLPDEYRTPTLEDLAWALARIPRWNGQTIAPWSVAQHCITGAMLYPNRDESTIDRLYFMLHDAEEMFTGDTPKPYKTPEQDDLSREIRRDIFENLAKLPYPEHEPWHHMDQVLAAAESKLLASPERRQLVELDCQIDDWIEVERAMEVVWRLQGMSVDDVAGRFVDLAGSLLFSEPAALLRSPLIVMSSGNEEVHWSW